MTALVTKHLPLVSGAPDGIKKLRELVLELAVCGRLLAQDASDEPAELLIERIEALKALQISSGAVKRQKATTQPTVQPNHAMPESWRFVQLGDVVEIVRGITFPASEKSKEPSPGRIACLRTANVQSQIEWDDLLYIDESFVSREDQFLQPNDIVMSMANSRELVGKVALVGGELLQRSTFGGFLGVLRPYLIEPRFVMALLRTPSARSALIDSASQTTNIANISLGKLRPLMVALPPLSEQHRIVAKVDELMALCDRLEADQADAEAAHAQLVQALLDSLIQATDAADFRASWQRLSEHFHTLFTTEASIDALKQTVLQLAVMGLLSKQADSDPSASTLLGQIVTMRTAAAASSNKRNVQKPIAPVLPQETPYALPNGWVWTRAEAVSEVIVDCPHSTPKFVPKGVLCVDTNSVKQGALVLARARYVDQATYEERIARLVPQPGDIVFAREGSVGESMVIPQGMVCCLGQRVMLFRPCLVFPDYFRLALSEPGALARSLALHKGIGAKHVNVADMRNALIPLPPLPEQHRIVAKVDELMALCDELKAQLADAGQTHDQLATALCKQATDMGAYTHASPAQ